MGSEKPLDGKVALITGASAGIGRATSLSLAQDGASIALVARRESVLEDLETRIEREFDTSALALPTDIRESEDVVDSVKETVDQLGALDILVNNAGVTGGKFEDHLENMSQDEFHNILETNVNGMFYATCAALPYLRETKGNLVFVGSSASKFPRPGSPVYAASKWWTRGFALSVEGHVGGDGVAVTLVNPTAVRTDVWPDLNPGEAAEPEEVASIISMAVQQAPHTTLSEIDLFRRDMMGKFLPEEVDLELAYDIG